MNEKMSKTIAQQLNIKKFPFEIKDRNGRLLYYEESSNYWEKYEYDSDGNKIYFGSSYGFWAKREYGSDKKPIYYENSNGYIYRKNSNGKITDNRPKENAESTMTLRELFRQIRLSKHYHLGLGDIRLTVAEQDEICDLVESLIEKSKDAEQ